MQSVDSLGVVIPCHNEGDYVGKCLSAIRKAGAEDVLVILDRCTDRSEQIVRSFAFPQVYKKESTTWKNSYSENIDIGFRWSFDKGLGYVSVIDADIYVPTDFFRTGLEALKSDANLSCVSSRLQLPRTTTFERLYHIYERLFRDISLNREARGACRIYRVSDLERLYKIGSLKDVIAPDTYLSSLFLRPVHELPIVSMHARRITLSRCIHGQILSGKARRELKLPLWKTVLHSIFRLRPFVLVGYFRK
jgi:glycosyltransferase involved in cell wall biosynthesis